MSEGQWPDDWADRLQGKDCALCASLGQGDSEFSVSVGQKEYVEVQLERRSRLPGYCIVVFKLGHVAEPSDLDAAMAAGYWQNVLQVGRAIQAVFAPVKLNYLTLGNPNLPPPHILGPCPKPPRQKHLRHNGPSSWPASPMTATATSAA